MAITFLDHGTAAHHLATDITGRRHHIVTGMASPDLAAALHHIPAWTGYVQNAPNGPVLVITGDPDHAPLVAVAGLLTPATVVLTIEKAAVPASTLRAAFGDTTIPDDGTRDVIFLDSHQDGLYRWPTLMVDAIALDDPSTATSIRLSDMASQN